MFLKRIELQGFKSFADKYIITFDSDVIGIVGPNGCGKSNINDAIRWVLGEQSVKSLRGNNMSDVIFSGSTARKAVNMAEVTLVFDNSRHIMNVEFEEVEVTRRLHRTSGEGEYFINKILFPLYHREIFLRLPMRSRRIVVLCLKRRQELRNIKSARMKRCQS